MLIQALDYVRECGGDPQNLSLYGKDEMGTVWSICKMNMLLHGVSHADIRNADTLADPRHMDPATNELMRFDRVLATMPLANLRFSVAGDRQGRQGQVATCGTG